MIRILLFFILISYNLVFSQTFDWEIDGYENGSNGGEFINIDGSKINFSISGLVNANFFSVGNQYFLKSGMNDQYSGKMIHQYIFNFSEIVDVEFTIGDINIDSNSLNC